MWELIEHGVADAFKRALPVREEEPLVLLNRSADASPSMFRLPSGFSLTPARFSSHVNARNALLSCKTVALPRNWFVPDFVITVTAAPPVMPCSASKLLVAMLTSWMLSTGGTYTA